MAEERQMGKHLLIAELVTFSDLNFVVQNQHIPIRFAADNGKAAVQVRVS